MLQYLVQFLPASLGVSPELTAHLWALFTQQVKAMTLLTWANYERVVEARVREEYLALTPGEQYRAHVQKIGGHII